MEEIKFQKNAYPSDHSKPKDINDFALNEIYQKNFIHGLKNARNILASLEQSIEKSSSYEDKLLRCRTSHKHSHDFNDWPWDIDFSDEKNYKASKRNSGVDKSIQTHNQPVNLVETWSTMSIVILQFQYEELSKRYESLLKSFNDKCSVINAKNSTIARLRQRARVMHAQLASTHKTLLCIGEKYLALKKRRHEQLQQYDKKIEFLKKRVREIMTSAENARVHLDNKLSQSMALEHDSEYALLLAEMKNCNKLFLENLKLKAQLEEYIPGCVNWKD